MQTHLSAIQRQAAEWACASRRAYADPFNEIELDALITGPDGQTWRVPAFWAGGAEWRFRFAAPAVGAYTVTTACSDPTDPDLHGQTATLTAQAYTGANPLLQHGPLRVSADQRRFEHADGTPFFWFGDTWWMGLCRRLPAAGFQELVADRSAKGFTLIQMVAGLYPDMPEFDERGANEAGWPWEPGYARLNPAYFAAADQRVAALVDAGLVPLIVGSWGFYLELMSPAKMRQHWRNLIARWGAYPIVWCLAGEAEMPYYFSHHDDAYVQRLIHGWVEMARYIRSIDPLGHPLTLHSAPETCALANAEHLLAANLVQSGHGAESTLGNSVAEIQREVRHEPRMPVLIGEASYEGILHYSGAEVQRFIFWTTMLSGAAGYTYGANGLWQVNTRERRFGASPWGGTWGNLPWEDAMRLPGSGQVGLGKRFLERYEWWRFEPHQEWVSPPGSPKDIAWPFAAGLPRQLRVIYMYGPIFYTVLNAPEVCVVNLEADVSYSAFFFDPRTGEQYPLGRVEPDAAGRWVIPLLPEMSDWVVVLEAQPA